MREAASVAESRAHRTRTMRPRETGCLYVAGVLSWGYLMNAMPYRTMEPAAAGTDKPREFVCTLHDHDSRGGLMGIVPGFLVGGVACAVLGVEGHMTAGLLAFVAAVVWAMRRRSVRESGVVLRVENGSLHVFPWRGAPKAEEIPLEDLLDVRLDSKTSHKPQRETRPGVFAVGGYSGALPVDVARIVLVLPSSVPPIELGKEYVSHSEVVEKISKLKKFLRSCDWLPLDERPVDSAP
jgi:hypothetical protein